MLKAMNVQRKHKHFRTIRERMFTLVANEHLENGHRIEDFLGDLPTSFRVDWTTSKEDRKYAQDLVAKANKKDPVNLMGIYASAYNTARNWGFWDEHKWFELIKSVHEHDKSFVFVLIGAEWDTDLAQNLLKLMWEAEIPYVNTVGATLGAVIEVMKKLHYFFAFPSGLGILAPTVNCPVTMFYPKNLEPMINAWASPEDIETGLYHGTLFCEPEEAFKWAVENKKI
jgi:ADP-heptose:LPS heptosyltransferase